MRARGALRRARRFTVRQNARLDLSGKQRPIPERSRRRGVSRATSLRRYVSLATPHLDTSLLLGHAGPGCGRRNEARCGSRASRGGSSVWKWCLFCQVRMSPTSCARRQRPDASPLPRPVHCCVGSDDPARIVRKHRWSTSMHGPAARPSRIASRKSPGASGQPEGPVHRFSITF